MSEAVYVLCAIASLACALRLRAAWLESRTPLLFWSALCFVGLALNNALLVADFVLLPEADLSVARTAIGLASLSALLYGLIWHAGAGE